MERAGEYVAARLPALLELIQDSDIRELELQEGSIHIRLHRRPGQEAEVLLPLNLEAPEQPAASKVVEITCPLVGTFYRAPKPGMPPLVTEESPVGPDTVVGIVEALREQLTEIQAECTGRVIRVLATDGQPVEYGQVLFEVSTDG